MHQTNTPQFPVILGKNQPINQKCYPSLVYPEFIEGLKNIIHNS